MDLESRLRLERDLPAVVAELESTGDLLETRQADLDGLFWVHLQPQQPGCAPFIARVLWTVYPGRPPSVLFVDEVGGSSAATSSWPAAGGYRAGADICKPFTAEGQAVHPEWADGPHAWTGDGNPFLFVVQTIQADVERARGARAA